jgi:hypothetical protein
LAVPDLRNITNGILAQPDTNPDDNSFSGTEIRVSRSISGNSEKKNLNEITTTKIPRKIL